MVHNIKFIWTFVWIYINKVGSRTILSSLYFIIASNHACATYKCLWLYDRHYYVIFIQNVQVYGCASFLCINHYKKLTNAIANACTPEKGEGKV
jgi:hypothetical protein